MTQRVVSSERRAALQRASAPTAPRLLWRVDDATSVSERECSASRPGRRLRPPRPGLPPFEASATKKASLWGEAFATFGDALPAAGTIAGTFAARDLNKALMAQLLHEGLLPRPPAHGLDAAALVAAAPLGAPAPTPHGQALNADAFLAGHRSHCGRCRVHAAQGLSGPAPACYFHELDAHLRYGFYVPLPGLPAFDFSNFASSYEYASSIDVEIEKLLNEGRADLGTSDYISPMLSVVKPKDLEKFRREGGKLRARPCLGYDQVINLHTAPAGFRYVSVSETLAGASRGGYITKIDMRRYYWQLPLSKQHVEAKHFAFRWRARWDADSRRYVCDASAPERIVVPRSLMFGWSVAPLLASIVSAEIVAICRARGARLTGCLLDDFVCIDATYAAALRSRDIVVAVMQELGMELSLDKLEGPAQRLEIFGIGVDLARGELYLAEEQCLRYVQTLREARAAKFLGKRELQSLCGKMGWASCVLRRGRWHMSALLKPLARSKFRRRVKLTDSFFEACDWFVSALSGGRDQTSPIFFADETVPLVVISGDASEEHGWAALCGPRLLQRRWLPHEVGHHSTWKEMAWVVESAVALQEHLAGKVVVFVTDNASSALCLNAGRAHDAELHALLGELHRLADAFSFHFCARWSPRDQLWEEDHYSRSFASTDPPGRLFHHRRPSPL